ncbi:hypothetical protein QYF61_002246 [Mycteria americana]|uniref:Uncharacterized protein n=1 Tax=Mycteria americana TaxID=33587 RepID=A0AAN7NDD8_MYCAM|nr:hypothetical protein QYF61_002246 [Mycteria americana]
MVEQISTLQPVEEPMPEQRDLNRLEKRANRYLTKSKCKVLHRAREQFCRKGPVSPGGQVVLEPAISPCCKESQTYPQLHVTRTREGADLHTPPAAYRHRGHCPRLCDNTEWVKLLADRMLK